MQSVYGCFVLVGLLRGFVLRSGYLSVSVALLWWILFDVVYTMFYRFHPYACASVCIANTEVNESIDETLYFFRDRVLFGFVDVDVV